MSNVPLWPGCLSYARVNSALMRLSRTNSRLPSPRRPSGRDLHRRQARRAQASGSTSDVSPQREQTAWPESTILYLWVPCSSEIEGKPKLRGSFGPLLAVPHPYVALELVDRPWGDAGGGSSSKGVGGSCRKGGRRRTLYVSRTIFGMVRVDGDLDPETGETLPHRPGGLSGRRGTLGGPPGSANARPVRADGLGEICRQWLDRLDRPTVGGERPHVTLTVSLEALQSGADGPCELEHTGPVLPEVARKILCDASVSRVVLSGASEPLDVGRRTQVVTAGIRRAVVARDRHCAFPGCDRPPSWCECHHVWHWEDGGPTALHNLVLLCRRHHGFIHSRRGFSVEMVGGRPLFRRPDGAVLEGRAPPAMVAA
jgi:hypothetical protein